MHLVAKIGDINAAQQEATTPQTQRRTTNTFMSFMNNIVRNETSNAQGINSSRRTRATLNDQNSGVVPFNESECKEAIAQNIVQINNILEYGNFNNEDSHNKEYYYKGEDINCFDLLKRKLIKGQWVDVKDTVDQWLEAQVINVKDNSVQIHYNRWGTRWDEWIEMNSERIMPFRFHTRQSCITNYHSPFPNSKPDANVSLITAVQQNDSRDNQYNNFLDIFDDVMAINKRTISLLQQIKQNKEIDKDEKQLNAICNMTKLLPILDKMGRVYVDMSSYISNAMKKNNLEDLNRDIFQDAQKNNELLKPYTSDEQKSVNEKLMNKNSQRTIRSGTLHFIPPANKLDRMIINQIPLIDTPLTVSNRSIMLQPVLDVYVHTFVYPSTMMASRGILDNQANSPGLDSNALNNVDDESQQENNDNNNNNNNNNSEQNEDKNVQEEKVVMEQDNNNNDDNGNNNNNNKNEDNEEPNHQLGKKRKRSKEIVIADKKVNNKKKKSKEPESHSIRTSKRDKKEKSNKKNK